MKIQNVSNGYFLVLLFIFTSPLYTMEQDKSNWAYYNNIGGELDEFDFSIDEKKLGLNFDYKDQLVSDDVNDPNRWVADPKNAEEAPYALPAIFTKVFKIRKKWTYEPPKVENNQPITWLVLHGTFGQDTKGYFDDQDKDEQNLRHIKRAASAYSTRKAKNLELLSFKWASKWRSKFYGGLSDTDRVKGAGVLHKFLQYMKYDENNELVILSHSHGCNLINYFTHLIKPERPIDLLIHFACPRRKKEEHYQPTNYKKLIYFFSDGDVITVLGRVPEHEIGGTLKNITKAVVFPTNHNLDQEANSVGDIRSYFKEMTNEFRPSKKANSQHKLTNLNALGLHTRINDTDPGHSPIVDAVKHLTTIMETLSKDYPEHVNTIFDLTIDDTKNPPMMISVKKEYINTQEPLLQQKFDVEESVKAPLKVGAMMRLFRSVRQGAALGGYGGAFMLGEKCAVCGIVGGPQMALTFGVVGAATGGTVGGILGGVGGLAKELTVIGWEHLNTQNDNGNLDEKEVVED